MTSTNNNPCLTCTIHQDCCTNLHGLKLTGNEYESHFRQYAGELAVSQANGIYTISRKNGGACPNWKNGGCGIYSQRPVECRLFPFTMSRIVTKGHEVVIGFHSDVNCPQKEKLLMPVAEAHALMRQFAIAAYGKECVVRAYRVPGGGILAKIWGRIAALYAPEI